MKKLFILWATGILLIGFLLQGTIAIAQPVTIRAFTWKVVADEVFARWTSDFERANPEIKVEWVFGPASTTERHDMAATRFRAADGTWDVIWSDTIWTPEFAAAGWVIPLDDRFPETERTKFLPGALQSGMYQGRIYAISWHTNGGVLFYRKDIVTDPPKSWTELVAMAKRYQKPGENLFGFAGQFDRYEGLICNILEYIWAYGGDIISPDGKRAMVNSPETITALKFVRDEIVYSGVTPPGMLAYKEHENQTEFIEGRLVFIRNWPHVWGLAQDPKRSKIVGKVGIAPLPAGPAGNFATSGGWNLAINKFSKNHDAAWKFIQHTTSYSFMKDLALLTGRPPGRMAVYEDPEIKEKLPQFKWLLPALMVVRNRPQSPLYPAISEKMQVSFHTILSDSKSDIPKLIGALNGEIQRLLELIK